MCQERDKKAYPKSIITFSDERESVKDLRRMSQDSPFVLLPFLKVNLVTSYERYLFLKIQK